jgi:hypothetical protein
MKSGQRRGQGTDDEALREKLQLQQEGLAIQVKELAAVTSGFRSVREQFLEN